MTADNETSQEPVAPALKVITPDATAEEVAAIVAVLAAAGSSEKPAAPVRSTWAAPHRATRDVHHPRPGAWRISSLPR